MNTDDYNELINDLVNQCSKELEDQVKFMIDEMKENLFTIFHDKLQTLLIK